MSIAQLTNSTAKLQGFSAILTRKSPKNRRLKLKRDCRPASVSPPYLHDYFMSFSAHLCTFIHLHTKNKGAVKKRAIKKDCNHP